MLRFGILSTMLVGSMLVGCGGQSYPPTSPVSGTVTLDGKPVEGATVTFVPNDSKLRPAAGVTDSSGKYTLTSFRSGDGAMPGEYKVTVSKFFSEAGPSPYDNPDAGAETAAPAEASLEDQYAAYEKAYKDAPKGPPKGGAKTPKSGNELPDAYANVASSGLSTTVASGTNTFPIELKSKQ